MENSTINTMEEQIMSVNNLKRQRGDSYTDNHSYRINVVLDDDPYWDEGLRFYPTKNKSVIKWKKKRLLSYQVRMYKTWKHNRKHQWK